MKKYIYLTVFFAGILLSCEKIIDDIDIEVTSPRIVLGGYIRYQKPVYANITSSWSPLEHKRYDFIDDANVRIYEGEQEIAVLGHVGFGDYLSEEAILVPKKQYTIKVNASGHPEASSSFMIPGTVEITSMDTLKITKSIITENGYHEYDDYQISFTINDPPDEENFYIVKMYIQGNAEFNFTEHLDTTGFPFIPSTNISTNDFAAEFGISGYEPWIIEKDEDQYINRVRGGICYSDILFNGKEHTFNLEIGEYDFTVNGDNDFNTIYVFVESISKEYYLYLKSIRLYEASEENPLSHEVNIFSNVNNGLGIVGAFNVSTDSIKVTTKFVPDYN